MPSTAYLAAMKNVLGDAWDAYLKILEKYGGVEITPLKQPHPIKRMEWVEVKPLA